MSEITKYEAYKKKLEGLCEEHNLTYRLRHDVYPMSLTIMPLQDMYTQMDMLESVEDKGYTSQDAYIKFIMEDGEISHKIGGTFTIGDALFTKLRALFKNLHYCWVQYFFRDVIENRSLRKGMMPVIDEDEAEDFPEEDVPEDEDDELDDGEMDDGLFAVDPDDPDIQKATSIVRAENKATLALLQRRMQITATKALRLMDALEELGVVGPANGEEPREVLAADAPDEE